MRYLILVLLNMVLVPVPHSISQVYNRVQINLEGPIHFIVADSSGRREGYDPRVAIHYDEIPYAYYETSGVDSHNPDFPPLIVREFAFRSSIDDPLFKEKYTVEIIGIGQGIFKATIGMIRDPGKGASFDFKGVIDVGQNVKYSIAFFADTMRLLTMTKIVQGLTLFQDLDNCFKLRLIKNQGLYTSLKQKATNAISQHAKGQDKSAVNLLQAFLNEVNAQTEKGLDKDAAAILTEDAEALIKQWQK